jgi:hypothetical protein
VAAATPPAAPPSNGHIVVPSAPGLIAGARVIYQPAPNGRQYRGKLLDVTAPNEVGYIYADFQADSGEIFKGSSLNRFQLCSDDTAAAPAAAPAVKERQTVWVPKAQQEKITNMLGLTQAVGNVALGDTIYNFEAPFADGYVAVIDICNGDTGPFVDAYLALSDDNTAVVDEPPRRNIEGTYTFVVSDQAYVVDVKFRR